MKTKRIFLSLFALMLLGLLSACKEIVIKNSEFCAVAGVLSAGMNCGNSLKDETREMNLDETIAWLEPQEAIKDENGKVVVPERGAAICQSSDNFNDFKTALEVACKMLGKKCSYELQQTISNMDETLNKSKKSKKRTQKGLIEPVVI